jgi:hypothetical protein
LSVEHAYIYIYTKQDTIFVQRNDGTPFTHPSIPKLPQSQRAQATFISRQTVTAGERVLLSLKPFFLWGLPPLSLVDMLQATGESFGT